MSLLVAGSFPVPSRMYLSCDLSRDGQSHLELSSGRMKNEPIPSSTIRMPLATVAVFGYETVNHLSVY